MQISRSSSGSDIKSGADSSSRFWSNEAAAALCSTDVEMTNENVHIWAWSSRLWEETECFACMFFIGCPAETRILHIHHIPAHFIPLNISTSHSSSTRVMIYISTQQPLLPPQIDFFSRRKRPSLSLTLNWTCRTRETGLYCSSWADGYQWSTAPPDDPMNIFNITLTGRR